METNIVKGGFKALLTPSVTVWVKNRLSSSSSHRWTTRQAKDPYARAAGAEGYRARSAFKLLEIDAKHQIFYPDMTVIECGAAPGAWTQVTVNSQTGRYRKTVKSSTGSSLIIGCDLLPIQPIEGATLLPERDFTDPDTQKDIKELMRGRFADLVLSDMAPNASGDNALDHDAIVKLVYSALRFSVLHSAEGAAFLAKIWDGNRSGKLEEDLRKFYKHVKTIKPKSSRKESAEKYVLAQGFRGLKTSK